MDPEETWNRFRQRREEALAAEFGWLTLTSYTWLPERPGPLESFPGLWSAGPEGARLEAGEADGVYEYDPGAPVEGSAAAPLAGVLECALDEDESRFWVRTGSTVVELGRRDGRYMVRTRERRTPRLDAFDGVPVFGYDPGWVLEGRFEPLPEPRREPVETCRADASAVATVVGHVAFAVGGRGHRLAATAAGNGMALAFRDGTSGTTTAAWRFLPLPDADASGSLVLDFNRTLNYPMAFTEFGVCPAPVEGNRIDAEVAAGERRP